jgi:hypothetical protein
VAEALEVDVAAAWRREEQARVDPRRHLVEGVEHALTKRNGTNAARSLAALLELAAAEPTAHMDDAGLSVDVSALERDPFLGPKACTDGEDGDRPVAGVELVSDGRNLVHDSKGTNRDFVATLRGRARWLLRRAEELL